MLVQFNHVSVTLLNLTQAPEPEEPWMGVRSALRDGHLCPQFDIATGKPTGDEDCLTLNIYTPKVISYLVAYFSME